MDRYIFGFPEMLEIVNDAKAKYILVTGGCGYIGSHLIKALLIIGKKIINIDNLMNSTENSLKNLPNVVTCHISLSDENSLDQIFSKYRIETVFHLAGLKSVKESVLDPLKYYDNNIISTITLLKIMKKYNVGQIIFSSSATVYEPALKSLQETDPINPKTPYGRTKYIQEMIIEDFINSEQGKGIILRYFNPIGCDPELIESPKNIPENLAPFIIKVLKKELPFLTIFGNDYDTTDGTCIRDYIHIDDLIDGHIAALNYLQDSKKVDIFKSSSEIFNLGTGQGYSVLEILKEFENQHRPIPFKIGERRKGDVPVVYANVEKAKLFLGWSSKKSLKEMVKSIIKSV